MKSVLCLCVTDNANRTYKTVKALRSAGVVANGFRTRKHPFNYPKELPQADYMTIAEQIKLHDVIWLTMGSTVFLKWIPFDKEIIVTHSGTKYRQNPQGYNQQFNLFPKVRHFMITADLMGLGAINEQLINARIIDGIERKINNENKLVVAHYPSNPTKKGSEVICEVVRKLQKKHDFIFRYRSYPLPYSANIEAMQRADIYIDQLISEQNGKELQQPGNQAYEAVASGCVVITNKTEPTSEEPFTIANCEHQLEMALGILLTLSKKELREVNDMYYNRLMANHSLESIGNQLKSII
jgi:hypothetical protein